MRYYLCVWVDDQLRIKHQVTEIEEETCVLAQVKVVRHTPRNEHVPVFLAEHADHVVVDLDRGLDGLGVLPESETEVWQSITHW